MNVKKLTVALAVTAASGVLTSGDANSYTIAEYGNGLVVPHVYHNGATDTTTVGLTSRSAGTVYWTFFDVNSKHVADGSFSVTADDMYPFIWADESGIGLEGMNGYLVFSLDTKLDGVITTEDTPALAGNAFQVNTSFSDVAFIPTLPLVVSDYDVNVDLTAMDNATITGAANAAQAGERVDMRYFIDNAEGGTDTAILVWSPGDINGTHTVNMYDDEQNRRSVNFELEYTELNVFNPEGIAGRPADFLDGFIAWEVDHPVFTYSIIYSPAFGATQTILGTHGSVD